MYSVSNLLNSILKSYTLRKYKKESMAGLFCGVISKVFLTGWMIYSMIVYFNNSGTSCDSYFPLFVYMAYGFYVLMQSCIFA